MSTDPYPGSYCARKYSLLLKIVLVFAGTLSMILGVIGIVVPLLPTTPFLLLAAYCYARSSPRLLHWLLTNRWCGEYIRNYREGRGMPLRQKLVTLGILWLTIGYGGLAVTEQWWLRGLLFGIAVAVSAHLLRVKTRRLPAE